MSVGLVERKTLGAPVNFNWEKAGNGQYGYVKQKMENRKQLTIWMFGTASEKRNSAQLLYFCLRWWPKWRHMMPLDNRAINKAGDKEDLKYRNGSFTFMLANVALHIVRLEHLLTL